MNLRELNALAAVAHAAALGGLTLAFRNQPASARRITLVRDAIDTESTQPLNSCTSLDFPLKAVPQGSVDPLQVLQFYFGVSVAAHAFYAIDPGGVYTDAVRSGNNLFRWVEYAASAGSMAWLLAALDGNRNFNAALLAAGSISALNLLGNASESLLKQGPRHAYFQAEPLGRAPPRVEGRALATVFVTAWVLLFLSFYATLSAFQKQLNDVAAVPDAPPVPSWLKYVGPTQLLQFCAFGTIQFLQIKELWRQDAAMRRGEPVTVRDFEGYERMYILLSFVTKLTLGVFVGYGLLKRTDGCTDP
jgi:hypothetical protein